CYYRVLQRFGIAGRAYYLLQRLAHARAGRADKPAYARKLAAGRVGYLLLARDGAGYLVLQEAVGLDRLKEVVYAGLLPLAVAGGVGLRAPGRGQDAGYVHELARVQHAAHVRSLQTGAHVAHARETRAAAGNHHGT